MDARDILIDAFGRLPENVRRAVDGLDPDQLRTAPAEGANTVGWLVWHLTRVQDAHVSELLDEEQVYLGADWASKFGRQADESDTGYGHAAADVAAVRPESAQALID